MTACGVLLLDKPLGLSSNAALQRVRSAFGRVKAGHTGSLDPLATGMLPLCLGEATKVAGDLLEGAKAYEFTLRLGERRSTGDAEGEVVETLAVPADWPALLAVALAGFRGPIQQVPPMYSALKRDGEPLYRAARRGEVVERAARPVTITRLEVLAVRDGEADLRVDCSKGTYVRTLGEDLARAIGTCGYLGALRRVFSAPFEGRRMYTLEEIQQADDREALVLPADAALPHLAALELETAIIQRLLQGQRVRLPSPPTAGRVRAYDTAGTFRGVAEIDAGGLLHPRRLFNGLDAMPA